jgi:hypothetical protein
VQTVTSPILTEMAGFTWAGGSGSVAIRARAAGRWTQWETLDASSDEGPDADSHEHTGHLTTEPTWLGHGVRQLEVKVISGEPRALRLVAIHSTEPAASPLSISGAGASPAEPRIYSRAEWGADESWRSHNANCDKPDYASRVRNAYVHHTVNDNTYAPGDVPSLIRGLYHFHVFTNGWCDIGYNFLVDRFGRAWEGRFGGITKAVIGAHTGGFNTGATGVSLIGNLDTAGVSSAMYAGLRDLLTWKLAYHGVDPNSSVTATAGPGSSKFAEGTTVTLPTIAGHRDVSLTSCPGSNAYGILGRLRADVQAAILSTPPYPLPGWTPVSGQTKVLALNGYGGLQPNGGADAVPHSAYWNGWDITRGVTSQIGGGHVLDGYGGLHPYGSAAYVSSATWHGWDIARGVASSLPNQGYVVDGWGGVHPYGGAAPTVPTTYWPNWDIARGIVVNTTGTGGYVLDGWGGVHSFGSAPGAPATAYWSGWDIARAIVLRADGVSGYTLDGWGGVHPFGGAPDLAVTRYTSGQDRARGLVLTADGQGGYVLDKDGSVWPVGNVGPLASSGTWSGKGFGRGLVVAQ